jgi:hypothetical protein
MKNHRLFMFSLMFLFLSSSFAQSSFDCTTPPVSANFGLLESVRIPDWINEEFRIKVYVHVLVSPETGPAQSMLGVNEAMKQLYSDFDPLGIFLVWDGEIDFVENPTSPAQNWYKFPNQYFSDIIAHNYHTDGVDIYLGDDFGDDVKQSAGGIGDYSAFFVSGREQVGSTNEFKFYPQGQTISHEMGHVFFLWHTFNGTFDDGFDNPNNIPECLGPDFIDANGVIHNPWSTGDFVVDTPPDPKIEIYDGCNYINPDPSNGIYFKDVCGNNFAPLEDNIMSYYGINCWQSFTTGQKRRMKNAIKLLPELQSTKLTGDYAYIRGKSLVCLSDPFIITSNNYTSLEIEYSENIDVTGNTSVTPIVLIVENEIPISAEGEPAWISVSSGGVELTRKNFWIGKPQTVVPNSIFGPTPLFKGAAAEYIVPSKIEGAEFYTWTFPGYLPSEVEDFTSDFTDWQYDYLTKYGMATVQAGGCSGKIELYGTNSCFFDGDADEFDVTISNPNFDCPIPLPTPSGIIYYPNPADSILEIDLSLQDYKVFTILIYDDSQEIQYSGESTNIIKSIDTFSLVNGTYYLHIYDGSELIVNKILVINHY